MKAKPNLQPKSVPKPRSLCRVFTGPLWAKIPLMHRQAPTNTPAQIPLWGPISGLCEPDDNPVMGL